jgi:hypothetical protein
MGKDFNYIIKTASTVDNSISYASFGNALPVTWNVGLGAQALAKAVSPCKNRWS